jgi:hypothetical protein
MLDTLHLCSLNCQGLGQKEKRQRLFQWVKNQKTHILYAQETHFTKNTTIVTSCDTSFCLSVITYIDNICIIMLIWNTQTILFTICIYLFFRTFPIAINIISLVNCRTSLTMKSLYRQLNTKNTIIFHA